jgi:peptidoglycan/LPS O-acetylase OafA/YrhL
LAPSAGTGQHGHEPALDGLRGIAVLTVLVHHLMYFLSPDHFRTVLPGGFLGVDLFFVLSGFLITRNLVEGPRHPWAGRFYAGRAWRLLPALIAMLASLWVLTLFGVLSQQGDLTGTAAVGVAQLFNYSGHLGVTTSAYLSHLWSLSVEGQFYVVWPLVCMVAGRRALVAALVAVGAVVVWRVHSYDGEWSAVYALTEMRIDQLLIGACLALSSAFRRATRPLAAPAAVFLVLAVLIVDREDGWLYGLGQTGIALACASVVAGADQGWGATVLRWRPLVAVGFASYGLYLWHFPAIRYVELDLGLTNLAGIALATAIAGLGTWASWQLLEGPLRRWRRRARVAT